GPRHGHSHRHIQIDMLQIISYISERKTPISQRYLAGYRIDEDMGCGRQPAAAAVEADAGAQIEPIAMPWAAQHAILRNHLIERPEPVRANRRVRDEHAILEFENAERLGIEFDQERQPRAQLRYWAER